MGARPTAGANHHGSAAGFLPLRLLRWACPGAACSCLRRTGVSPATGDVRSPDRDSSDLAMRGLRAEDWHSIHHRVAPLSAITFRESHCLTSSPGPPLPRPRRPRRRARACPCEVAPRPSRATSPEPHSARPHPPPPPPAPHSRCGAPALAQSHPRRHRRCRCHPTPPRPPPSPSHPPLQALGPRDALGCAARGPPHAPRWAPGCLRPRTCPSRVSCGPNSASSAAVGLAPARCGAAGRRRATAACGETSAERRVLLLAFEESAARSMKGKGCSQHPTNTHIPTPHAPQHHHLSQHSQPSSPEVPNLLDQQLGQEQPRHGR